MRIEITRKHATHGRKYELPKDLIVTVISHDIAVVRVCFHWNMRAYPHRSDIDIDCMSFGMFDLESGTVHVMSGVSEEDAEEFENWFKSFS